MSEKRVVLLVEDDDNLRNNLKELIVDDGNYDVVALPDGMTALAWLASNPKPALIISDYLMHGKGSVLAKAADRVDLNTIIITGNREDALADLKSLGVRVPVFQKPFDIFALLRDVDLYAGRKPVRTAS